MPTLSTHSLTVHNSGGAERLRELGIEVASWEDQDLMLIEGIAVREGVNANGALFERDDLQRAAHTLEGKPIRILIDDNSNPTGHGFDPETNTFSPDVRNIGAINWAWLTTGEDEKAEIFFAGVIWRTYYPEIAARLRELHEAGQLRFSFEASRDFIVTPEGYRKCYNILFHGLAIVANPAEPGARSLMVAELLGEQGGNEVEEKIKELEAELAAKSEKVEELATKVAELTENLAEATANLENANKQIEALTSQRDALAAKVEAAEVEALGNERKEKLSKYGEVAESVETLGQMTKEEYAELLIKYVENYEPETASTVEAPSVSVAVSNGTSQARQIVEEVVAGLMS